MANATTIVTETTAITALIGVIVGAVIQLRQVRADRKEEQEREEAAPVHKTNLIVDGAETVVAVLRQDYERLDRENARMRDRIIALENQVSERNAKIADLELRLRKAESEIASITDDMAKLKAL